MILHLTDQDANAILGFIDVAHRVSAGMQSIENGTAAQVLEDAVRLVSLIRAAQQAERSTPDTSSALAPQDS